MVKQAVDRGQSLIGDQLESRVMVYADCTLFCAILLDWIILIVFSLIWAIFLTCVITSVDWRLSSFCLLHTELLLIGDNAEI